MVDRSHVVAPAVATRVAEAESTSGTDYCAAFACSTTAESNSSIPSILPFSQVNIKFCTIRFRILREILVNSDALKETFCNTRSSLILFQQLSSITNLSAYLPSDAATVINSRSDSANQWAAACWSSSTDFYCPNYSGANTG